MYLPFFFSPYDWLYILPGLLLGLWAQYKVRSAYAKYSKVASYDGRPASEVARSILVENNNGGVRVEQTQGMLSDHYDPRTEVLRLSEGVFGSNSLAALGIAAHEAGHAMQQLEEYGPMKLRNAVVPAVSFSSQLYFPLFLVGLIANWEPLMFIGIVVFALSVLFSFITLPVEFDASRRAMTMLETGGYVTREEAPKVKAVLDAAALTYVAAAVTAVLQLLRLLALARRRD